MTIFDVLIGLAPFAPMVLIASGLTYWLRASRWAWIAACLVAASVPGFFLTMYLRGVGFNAFGGACTPDKARGFMEAMQWVFVAQAAAGVIGCAILTGLAFRKSQAVGGIMTLVLTCVSVMTGFFIFLASGMTAVDGYAC